jgi:GDP-4-dehydro-6-deoxy-D-mannose reductase
VTHVRKCALVTGASGFAGCHLVEHLSHHTDWSIIGLSRRYAASSERVRHVVCDLQDEALLVRTIEHYRPDLIFHLAAQSYVPRAFASPADTIVNNVVAQINLFEACRTTGIDPVVLVVGSAEVYGYAEPDEMPLKEDQPFRPGNPYAVSKVTQDMLGYQYFRSYGMRVVRVRPFNHFGPGQSDRFVLSSFARQVAEAEAGMIEPTVLTGDLTSQRDFCDVRDVVRAYHLAVELGEPGEVYNIASGVAHGVGELLTVLTGLATCDIEVRQDPSRVRPSDVPVMSGDSTRFREATGWQPVLTVEQSLLDTLNYWREEIRHKSDAS